MEVTFKDVVALGSLGVSVAAFLYSSEANKKTQELNELVFRAETVNELLKEVHVNTSAAVKAEDRTASCLYAGALAKAEALFVKDANNRLVGQLFIDQVERGLLPQNCVVETLEALPTEQVAASVEVADAIDKQDVGDMTIGQYHALIASYATTASACDFAMDDVDEFARILSGQGIDGLNVYVARTVKSNSYAVTVDAGDDRGLAVTIRDMIQANSSRSAGNTGSDSFVQRNTDWFIDADCTKSARIGG